MDNKGNLRVCRGPDAQGRKCTRHNEILKIVYNIQFLIMLNKKPVYEFRGLDIDIRLIPASAKQLQLDEYCTTLGTSDGFHHRS